MDTSEDLRSDLPPGSDDARRIDALERQTAALGAEVARLREAIARLQAAPVIPPPPPSAAPGASVRPPARTARRRFALPAFDAEAVVGRVGVGVLLVGLAFLLRWGADQGWLSPPMRVGAVAVLGATLLAAGVAMRARETFGAILAGGGLAALYGALFAAFQLYGLVGVGTGLGLAAALTAGAFGLALRTRAPVLAVVGVLGAVGAPALMYRDAGGLAPTLAFLALALAGGGALWWRTAWRTLLMALTLGGWAALAAVRLKARGLPGDDPLAFTLATLVALAATAAIAYLRPARPVESPDAAGSDATEAEASEILPRLPSLLQPRALALWVSAVATAALVVSAWRLAGAGAAMVMLVGAALAGTAARLRPHAAEALSFATAVLVGWACVLAFDRDALAVGVIVATAALAGWDARRRGDASLPAVTDAALGVAGVVLATLLALADPPERGPALAGALVALGALGVVLRLPPALPDRSRRLTVLVGHVVVLLAVQAAFAARPGGTAVVAGLWGLYAAFLLVAGLRTGRAGLRWLGLSTLTATLVKLLVVDLADVPMAARVVVFLGLGVVLLVVAYLAPRLGRRGG